MDNDRVALHSIQIIDTFTDADSDGLPDSLEIEHGLNPAISDSTADFDEDSINNATENLGASDIYAKTVTHGFPLTLSIYSPIERRQHCQPGCTYSNIAPALITYKSDR